MFAAETTAVRPSASLRRPCARPRAVAGSPGTCPGAAASSAGTSQEGPTVSRAGSHSCRPIATRLSTWRARSLGGRGRRIGRPGGRGASPTTRGRGAVEVKRPPDPLGPAVRLIVARCEVSYTVRLSTVLPEAVRLLMVKPDGAFMVWSDGGGSSVKPLNWMAPPTVLEEEHEDGRLTRLTVRARGGEERLESDNRGGAQRRRARARCAARTGAQGGRRARAPGAAGRGAPALWRGFSAGQAGVADGHRAGGPDVPRRRGRVGGGGDQAGGRDRGRRAAIAVPRADPSRPRPRLLPGRVGGASGSGRRHGCSPAPAGSSAWRSTCGC